MDENFAKERSSNFSKDENEKLLKLFQKYSCITSKKTDSASVQQKEIAWKALVNEFNQGASSFRNMKQLQYKFYNMKKKARKEMSKERKEKLKTSGDPPPDEPSTSTEWLTTIMGDSISGRSSIYDSDSIFVTKKKPEHSTPLVTRKKNISLIDKKGGLVEKKSCREKLSSVFMEEEHRQNMAQKKELHELEIDYKERLYAINIEKAKVELEIEKKRLKSYNNCNCSDDE